MQRGWKLTFTMLAAAILPVVPGWASFAGTDVFLPSVGRAQGVSTWYTTVWIHNPGGSPATAQAFFLLRDQANTGAAPVTLSIPAGATVRYANAMVEIFNREGFGAIRVTSNQKLVVNSRIYARGAAETDRDSKGQFFAGIPASFAIGSGLRAQLLGVYQTQPGTSSPFRYNFGFVETTGQSCTVKVTPKGPSGSTLATAKSYPVRALEQRQFQFVNEFAGLSTDNARLEVEVTAGSGKVIAFGSGIANGSSDPSTFEMSFRDDLLAENAPGGGLTSVAHDGTLVGDGTSPSPLGIADGGVSAGKIASGQVVKSLNGLKDTVTLAAGANVSITPSGNTLTIAATGGGGGSGVPSVNGITGAVTIAGTGGTTVNTAGNTITVNSTSGGLTLPYSGYGVSQSNELSLLWVDNGGTGIAVHGSAQQGTGVHGVTVGGVGVYGQAGSGVGVKASSDSGHGLEAFSNSGTGVHATSHGGAGIEARSSSGIALMANSSSGAGIQATTTAGAQALVALNYRADGWAVYGTAEGSGATGVNGYGGATGVHGRSTTGEGVKGESQSGTAVVGESQSGTGVYGSSQGGQGVHGASPSGNGVYGESTTGTGVRGNSVSAAGVEGRSTGSHGVVGISGSGSGVQGGSDTGWGVEGLATGSSAAGVRGANANGIGVLGISNSTAAVLGENGSGGDGTAGVKGTNTGGQGVGVWGEHLGSGWGVYGASGSNDAVHGSTSTGTGIYGVAWGAGWAGYFQGDVNVVGNVSKSGGSFKIDHPQDPANRLLSHSFVESPDMMNVYNGNVVTDGRGEAVVELPAYFEALNRDFRYQLTVIGEFAQAIVAREVEDNRFVIRTDKNLVKVSWQVTGIRKDAWADAHRIPVEEDKTEAARGTFLHPELYGEPPERRMKVAPEQARVEPEGGR